MSENTISSLSRTAWTTGEATVKQVKRECEVSIQKFRTASKELVGGLKIDMRHVAKVAGFMAVTTAALAAFYQLARANVSTSDANGLMKGLTNGNMPFSQNNSTELTSEVHHLIFGGTTGTSNYVGDPDETIYLNFPDKASKLFSNTTTFSVLPSKVDQFPAKIDLVIQEEVTVAPTESSLVVDQITSTPDEQKTEAVLEKVKYIYQTKEGYVHLYPFASNECPLTDRALEIWGVSRAYCEGDEFFKRFAEQIGISACVRHYNHTVSNNGTHLFLQTEKGRKTFYELAYENHQNPLSCGEKGITPFGTPQGFLAPENPLGAELGKCYAQPIVGLFHADVNLIGKDGSVTMLGYYPKALYRGFFSLLATVFPVDGGYISPPPYMDGKGYINPWIKVDPWSKVIEIPCEGEKSHEAAIKFAKQSGFSYQLLNMGGEKMMNCFGGVLKLLQEAGVPISLDWTNGSWGSKFHNIGKTVHTVSTKDLFIRR